MRALRLGLVVCGLIALSGCVVGAPEIAEEVDVVQWDLRPHSIDESTEFHVGGGLLGLASSVASWSDDPDAELAADLLEGIDAVHVGVYEIDRSRDTPDDLSLDAREELADLGWQFVVRTRERGDEAAWVFARQGRGRTEMLVVAIDRREITVVRVDGDPVHLMDAAVRRDDDFMDVAVEIDF